jgi:hypothetical protein
MSYVVACFACPDQSAATPLEEGGSATATARLRHNARK